MEIQVEALTKVYRVPVKDPGLWGSVKSVFARKYREVRAVDDVSFRIDAGERVGFLGPNGAGKTTTLKMLTGLLHPTSGKVTVAGHIPQQRPRALLRAVTLVMGQKQQLIWDLPPMETFAMNRALFDLPRDQYQATLKELVELLELGPLLDKPTRNLSLGERMRCELAAALLHRPKILFLDEPTIGLDVQVQQQVRHFVDEYNKRHGATVMLTSHDMGDVSHLARRILLIDHGVVRFDGSLDGLRKRFGTGRKVLVRGEGDLTGLDFVKEEEGRFSRTVPAEQVNRVLGMVLQAAPQAEVSVMDPPLEEVLTRAFGETRATNEQGAA